MTYVLNICVYSALKKKEILPFAKKWMNLEGIVLSDIHQTEKDNYCMVSLTCGIRKKKVKLRETEI